MNENFKFFLVSLVISLPLWFGVNLFAENLGEFLVSEQTSVNPQVLTAQIHRDTQFSMPKLIRHSNMNDLKIEADSVISVFLGSNGREKILFEKESKKQLPVASLTKLMTFIVALENYDLSWMIRISENAVAREGEAGQLKIGEVLTIKDLLYITLMESSNDAAFAISELMGQGKFVNLMNLKAKELQMHNTYFINATGLDFEEQTNYSSAEDLVKLTKYLLEKPEIIELLSKKEFNLYSPDGVFHHKLTNTNMLLDKIPQIIGGKTGWSSKANGCLLLILKSPTSHEGFLVNIILGSGNRFGEMEKLIEWLNAAYKWE